MLSLSKTVKFLLPELAYIQVKVASEEVNAKMKATRLQKVTDTQRPGWCKDDGGAWGAAYRAGGVE